MEADETLVTRLRERSRMLVPDAPTNRPVPPVMVWVSTIAAMGKVTTARPVVLVKSWSPLAAVHVAVPDAVAPVVVALTTVNCEVSVNRPRWVALPVPTRFIRVLVVPCGCGVSVASKVPLNGNAEPPLASVSAAPPMELDGDVGALAPPPAHAAAKTQKTSTTYRIVVTFEEERQVWETQDLRSKIWGPEEGEEIPPSADGV